MADSHLHSDLYCREHEVRVGGCRCASPDKVKQYVDCPGETCPGPFPTHSPKYGKSGLTPTHPIIRNIRYLGRCGTLHMVNGTEHACIRESPCPVHE